MLTLKETSALLEILQAAATLEAAASAFQRAFVRAEHFRVAAAVCILIEDGLLPAAGADHGQLALRPPPLQASARMAASA